MRKPTRAQLKAIQEFLEAYRLVALYPSRERLYKRLQSDLKWIAGFFDTANHKRPGPTLWSVIGAIKRKEQRKIGKAKNAEDALELLIKAKALDEIEDIFDEAFYETGEGEDFWSRVNELGDRLWHEKRYLDEANAFTHAANRLWQSFNKKVRKS